MTEFQFAFLCIFALSIVIMIAYSLHRDRQEENTVWTTGITMTDDDSEGKKVPEAITYTTVPDFFDTTGGGQTGFEFARAYSRLAYLAAEQMAITGSIPGESKRDQAIAILNSFLRAQGHDTEDEDLSTVIPYLIDAAIREDAKPLF